LLSFLKGLLEWLFFDFAQIMFLFSISTTRQKNTAVDIPKDG